MKTLATLGLVVAALLPVPSSRGASAPAFDITCKGCGPNGNLATPGEERLYTFTDNSVSPAVTYKVRIALTIALAPGTFTAADCLDATDGECDIKQCKVAATLGMTVQGEFGGSPPPELAGVKAGAVDGDGNRVGPGVPLTEAGAASYVPGTGLRASVCGTETSHVFSLAISQLSLPDDWTYSVAVAPPIATLKVKCNRCKGLSEPD